MTIPLSIRCLAGARRQRTSDIVGPRIDEATGKERPFPVYCFGRCNDSVHSFEVRTIIVSLRSTFSTDV